MVEGNQGKSKSSQNKGNQGTILAFDIGIKNLAWCCAEYNNSIYNIKGWENENLVTGVSAEVHTCSQCSKKPSFTQNNQVYCVKHCNALRDMSGNLLRKIPPMAILKTIAKDMGASPSEMKSKESTLSVIEKKYAVPIIVKKAASLSLEAIHDALRAVVQRNIVLFSSCTMILLENQPAFKNPVMKSVQMMLFATLRDLVKGPPPIRLVHASKKSTGATKGDEGYAERKNMTEARVEKGFTDGTVQYIKGKDWFKGQAKRSDLAHCLCMVQDYIGQ